MSSSSRPWLGRVLPLVAVLVSMGAAVAACGDGGSTAGTPAPSITGAAAKRGQQLAMEKGCQTCHTTTGKAMTGPTWKGLAGSEVDLAGGRSVTADDAYLARAITDPDTEVVKGFVAIMPSYELTEREVADLVAYLRALSPDAPS